MKGFILRFRVIVILTFLTMSFYSCSSTKKIEKALSPSNLIVIDKRGEAVNPNNTSEVWHPFEYNKQLELINNGLKNNNWPDPKHKKVLIFIHGGLNTYDNSSELALRATDEMKKDGYYPIFINWNSAMFNSYWDHVYNIRSGERSKAKLRFLTAIPRITTDILKGVAYYPVYISSVFEKKKSIFSQHNRNRANKSISSQNAIIEMEKIHFVGNAPEYRFNLPYYLFSGIGNLTIWALQGAGIESWVNLSRRTKLMFRTSNEFNTDEAESSQMPADKTGAASLLFESIIPVLKNDTTYEITLIGHSMGAMVANEIVNYFGENMNIKNIVYMAAACTVNDWENSVLKYLEKNPSRKFYNLCLDPNRERNELNYGVLTPGSLLNWIDSYFANPESFLDRTLGSYENFAVALPIIPINYRKQITLKVFEYDNKSYCIPQKHGDFTEYKFWQQPFWDQMTKVDMTVCKKKCGNIFLKKE